MTADLLRRAAAKLREHAAATTFGAEGWVVDLKDSEVTTNDGGMMIADTMELAGGRPDASYIALMHPPVALALADWLDDAADRTGIPEYPSYGLPEKAMAVARAVLREEES
jgi:hypothetical protein